MTPRQIEIKYIMDYVSHKREHKSEHDMTPVIDIHDDAFFYSEKDKCYVNLLSFIPLQKYLNEL